VVRHAPLRLVAGGRDDEIDRPVDEADTGEAQMAGALGNDVQLASGDRRTCCSGAARRQHLLLCIEIARDQARKTSANGVWQGGVHR